MPCTGNACPWWQPHCRCGPRDGGREHAALTQHPQLQLQLRRRWRRSSSGCRDLLWQRLPHLSLPQRQQVAPRAWTRIVEEALSLVLLTAIDFCALATNCEHSFTIFVADGQDWKRGDLSACGGSPGHTTDARCHDSPPSIPSGL